jgi:outer membrane protein assembly factor BamB
MRAPRLPRTLLVLAICALSFAVCTLSPACKKSKYTPPVDNLTVFIGSTDSNLYALDANTGTKKWSFRTPGAIYASPTVYKGLVYIAGGGNTLYALDTATGAEIWSYPTGGSLGPTPTLSAGILYFTNGNDSVFALDLDTRVLSWAVQVGNPGYEAISASPTVYNGTLYLSGPQGWTMIALDATTGQQKWTDPPSYNLNFTTAVVTNPCYSGGLIYVGSPDGKIEAISVVTGVVQWSDTVYNLVLSSPTAADGNIYFCLGNIVYSVDAMTGKLQWQDTTQGAIDGSPIVVNGTLYIGDQSPHLYEMDAATGKLKLTPSYVGAFDLNAGPTYANGIVYLGSADQHVYSVDAASGTVNWAFMMNGYSASGPCVTGSDGSVYHPGSSGEQN